jgi:hypothetical protein
VVAGDGEGVAEVAGSGGVVCLEETGEGAGAQRTGVMGAVGDDGVEGVEGRALCHHAAGDLLVEEVDIAGVGVGGTALQDMVGHVVEGAGALHGGDTGGNLVDMIGVAQLGRGELAHAVLALAAQLGNVGVVAMVVGVGVVEVVERVAGVHAALGADGQAAGLVDGLADGDEVEEDGGVDGTGARREPVCRGQRLEHLGRQLQPRPMEGRDVAPVPGEPSAHAARCRCCCCCRALTYLLRQMIRADVDGDGHCSCAALVALLLLLLLQDVASSDGPSFFFFLLRAMMLSYRCHGEQCRGWAAMYKGRKFLGPAIVQAASATRRRSSGLAFVSSFTPRPLPLSLLIYHRLTSSYFYYTTYYTTVA